MTFLLFILYWVLGMLLALSACFSLGMAINAVIALLKIFTRPKNFLLLCGYLGLAIITALFAWGIFWLSHYIGQQTHYAGHIGLFVGIVCPGITALKIIPGFVTIALKQTSGIDVN